MLSLKTDLQFGLSKEEPILQLIKKEWGGDIKNTKELYDEFCIYDYESTDGTTWELKSRRNTKHKYPTTIIPVHKVRDVTTPQYFIFHFTDQTCYIQYDRELFDTFEKRYVSDYRFSSEKCVQHFEIPVSLLRNF